MALPPGYSAADATADNPDAITAKLTAADRARLEKLGARATASDTKTAGRPART